MGWSKGTIKFIDARTGAWGFIVPDDGSEDVHFYVEDADGPQPSSADDGAPVELDVVEGSRPRHARAIRLVGPPAVPVVQQTGPGNELKAWAFVPFIPFRARNGREYSSVLHYLESIALQEKWYFGSQPNGSNPYPILDNYLTYTFVKLRRESKAVESEKWATFNTGLVDRLYDPIFALFVKNDRPGLAPWHFYDFCIPGKGPSGKILTDIFDPLPETAKYFNNNFDMIFDTSKDIHVDYEHVILDGVRRDRFPPEFLREHLPEGFEWQDPAGQSKEERTAYLARLSETIERDARCMRTIKRRLTQSSLRKSGYVGTSRLRSRSTIHAMT